MVTVTPLFQCCFLIIVMATWEKKLDSPTRPHQWLALMKASFVWPSIGQINNYPSIACIQCRVFNSMLLILLPKSSCLLPQFAQVVLARIVQLYSRFLVLLTGTCSRHYIVTENYTLLGGTYLSEPNKEVLPWLPSLENGIITASRGILVGFLARRGTSL